MAGINELAVSLAKYLMKYILLIAIIFCFSCKRNENTIIQKKNFSTSEEIGIGKEFYSGDELTDFTCITNKNFKKVDSLSYTIYKNNNNNYYIVSLEKMLSNYDKELFKIIDTVIVKKTNNLEFKEYVKSESKINIQLFLDNKLLKEWEFTKNVKNQIPSSWYGLYQFTINENSDDWKEKHSISFLVTKDSLIYEAAGYQLFNRYELLGNIKNNSLQLKYNKLLDGIESAVLEKTKDFGSITFDGKNYFIESPFINQSFEVGTNRKYLLNKKPNG